MKKKTLLLISSLAAMVCIIIVVTAVLLTSDKIEPGLTGDSRTSDFFPTRTMPVQIREISDWHEAVGTVRPKTETTIQAQVSSQIVAVSFRPGDRVIKGQLLVTLDSRRLTTRLDQVRQSLKAAEAGKKGAQQGVAASEAAFDQAESAYNRIQDYFNSQAATAADLEQARAAYLRAKAELSRSKEALAGAEAAINQALEVIKEAKIYLGYTKITAPESGEILQRMVEPGDLAMPGKPLFILRPNGLLRLEAYVREGLIHKTEIGQTLTAHFDALNQTSETEVEEIIPYADPRTRTFLVKTTLSPIDGLYPGMFGKLLIPDKKQKAILIPPDAIIRVGQLELVMVRENDTWTKRLVKSGKRIEGMIEVLSGLIGNEMIGWEDDGNG